MISILEVKWWIFAELYSINDKTKMIQVLIIFGKCKYVKFY